MNPSIIGALYTGDIDKGILIPLEELTSLVTYIL